MIATATGEDARGFEVFEQSCGAGFDAGRALEHVERLSYPRRAGTPQERQAARYILHTFGALGLTRWRERFAVPHVARGVGVRLIFAVCAVAVVAGVRLWAAWPLAGVACWLAAAVLVNAPWKLAQGLAGRWPSRMASLNVLARRPLDAAEEAPVRVVFMAHYDSKSQAFPTGVRVGLVVAATVTCGLLAGCGTLAAGGWPTPVGAGAAGWLTTLVVALLAALAANVTGNRSPGALDNGTGLGTLLELARTWRPRPGAPAEVLFVATGSEEMGLDGARDFVRRHEAWWREKPTLLVNLDSVGAGERLYLAGSPAALRLAQATADDLDLPWARLRVLGAGMDHEPFAARGLAAVSVLGDVVGRSMAMHSRRDTIDRVETPALERAGRLAAEIAWAWAELHRRPEGRGWEVGAVEMVPAPHHAVELPVGPMAAV